VELQRMAAGAVASVSDRQHVSAAGAGSQDVGRLCCGRCGRRFLKVRKAPCSIRLRRRAMAIVAAQAHLASWPGDLSPQMDVMIEGDATGIARAAANRCKLWMLTVEVEYRA